MSSLWSQKWRLTQAIVQFYGAAPLKNVSGKFPSHAIFVFERPKLTWFSQVCFTREVVFVRAAYFQSFFSVLLLRWLWWQSYTHMLTMAAIFAEIGNCLTLWCCWVRTQVGCRFFSIVQTTLLLRDCISSKPNLLAGEVDNLATSVGLFHPVVVYRAQLALTNLWHLCHRRDIQ